MVNLKLGTTTTVGICGFGRHSIHSNADSNRNLKICKA